MYTTIGECERAESMFLIKIMRGCECWRRGSRQQGSPKAPVHFCSTMKLVEVCGHSISMLIFIISYLIRWKWTCEVWLCTMFQCDKSKWNTCHYVIRHSLLFNNRIKVSFVMPRSVSNVYCIYYCVQCTHVWCMKLLHTFKNTLCEVIFTSVSGLPPSTSFACASWKRC